MRLPTLPVLVVLAACSNARNPGADAAFIAIDAPADAAEPDAPPTARVLVINEVCAGDSPDWFEIVNVTDAPVPLELFVYSDTPDDFTIAAPFPAMTLAPGAYHVQDVDDATSGFRLGGDEALYVYRASTQALSDSVDWGQGQAPGGMSFARVPDTTGDFVTGAQSKGLPNP